MGGRYFVSGVQLGMLRAFASGSFREERYDAVKLIDSIINEQFIGNIENYKNPRIIIQEYHKEILFFPYDSEIDYLKAIIAFQKEKLNQIEKLVEQKYLNVGEIK
jgi:hypothetical protein